MTDLMTAPVALQLRNLLTVAADHATAANAPGAWDRAQSRRGLADACASVLELLHGEGATAHLHPELLKLLDA